MNAGMSASSMLLHPQPCSLDNRFNNKTTREGEIPAKSKKLRLLSHLQPRLRKCRQSAEWLIRRRRMRKDSLELRLQARALLRSGTAAFIDSSIVLRPEMTKPLCVKNKHTVCSSMAEVSSQLSRSRCCTYGKKCSFECLSQTANSDYSLC